MGFLRSLSTIPLAFVTSQVCFSALWSSYTFFCPLQKLGPILIGFVLHEEHGTFDHAGIPPFHARENLWSFSYAINRSIGHHLHQTNHPGILCGPSAIPFPISGQKLEEIFSPRKLGFLAKSQMRFFLDPIFLRSAPRSIKILTRRGSN